MTDRINKLFSYMIASEIANYAVFNGIKDFNLEAEDLYLDKEIDDLMIYRSDSMKYLSVVGFTRREWEELK